MKSKIQLLIASITILPFLHSAPDLVVAADFDKALIMEDSTADYVSHDDVIAGVEKLEKEIDDLFPQLQDPLSPGAAVMVIKDGKSIFTRCYGFADLEKENPVNPNTSFRLASVSKQFTATAIILLQEKGILSYDDYASDLVPEIKRIGDKITIRNLLNHTSGIPNYYPRIYEYLSKREPSENDQLFTTVDAVSLLKEWGELEFEPGEQFKYSNSGYEVLALIVERASGQSFASFLEKNIFKPLQMENAFVRDRPELERSDRAIGYGMNDQSQWTVRDDDPLNWILGAGGIYASLNDLYKWDQSLYTYNLLSKESLQEAFKNVVLKDGSTSYYGFGWELSDRNGLPAMSHSGRFLGFSNMFIRHFESRFSVIMLSSASVQGHGTLADKIAKIFLGQEPD